jgi:ABC-type polysaccharide/polyol phosphate transport system ATPase subunit
MSSDIAIRVNNLSKCYEIYDRPKDRLKQFVLPRCQQLFRRFPKRYYREFWAVKDINFEINKGETVGIIGRNGAGKSTLLQLICGTISPTAGSIEANGRVAALLELGAGFNPEFTGRENVYLNGQLLGLTKSEMNERFDEIAAFADIGEFIEQPVKTYSSGMFVRLAFSVAVHIEPQILVIDEALAVGDIFFQTKCMNRMEKIREQGTTILFVSHALEQVKRFCGSAIWIENGSVRLYGESNYVTDQYRDTVLRQMDTDTSVADGDAAKEPVRENVLAMIASVNLSATQLSPFESLEVDIRYRIEAEVIPKLQVGIAIRDAKGTYVFGMNTFLDKIPVPHTKGAHSVQCLLPKLPLLTGQYVIDVGLHTDNSIVCLDYIAAAGLISVEAPYFSEGLVYIEHEWKVSLG